jgi:hypothetical protein
MLRVVLTVIIEQRKRFLSEIMRFLDKTKQEQQYQIADEIPTPEQYWNFRMGTSGVGPTIACLE